MKLQTRFEEVTHAPVSFPTGMFANTRHVLLLSLVGGQGNFESASWHIHRNFICYKCSVLRKKIENNSIYPPAAPFL